MTNRDGPRLENQTVAIYLEIRWYPQTFLRKGDTLQTRSRKVKEVEVSGRELASVVARTQIRDLSAQVPLAPGRSPALLALQPTGVKSQMSWIIVSGEILYSMNIDRFLALVYITLICPYLAVLQQTEHINDMTLTCD